jgi:exo-1,4-beta-D-glucosaminidase
MLQSACSIKATGRQVSRPKFQASGWHAVSVPSTVLAALVADGTYRDPYFGINLRSIPGATYPPKENFSVLPMPKDSPFRCSWWYRTEFQLPANLAGKYISLNFDGINNRANVWVNGRQIAGTREVAGAYRTYAFDVTPIVEPAKTNVVAVETFAQTETDLGINWVDWNPAPPDKDMGLWRKVYLRANGPVLIRYPQVATRFQPGSLESADLTVEAELRNATKETATGKLSGTIGQISFEQSVTLGPDESRTVRFTPGDFPQLRLLHPRLWWPAQMGPQNLYDLSLEFSASDGISDVAKTRFGIREITSELDGRGHRVFLVNGERLLIRGAGWAPDMLLRESPERMKTEFRYIRDLNLNTIRLEGKMETQEFFDLADEQGLLVMAGWSCCDYWERWEKWKPSDLTIGTSSLRSQIMRMRSHPSLLAWLNGSDNPPPANVEKAYIDVLKDADWFDPFLSSASAKETTVTGPSGVKMSGPYDYVGPDYWLTAGTRYGGASGFITETSGGPSIPPIGSLKKMLPREAIQRGSVEWNYHSGLLGFKDLNHLEEAMNAIYGSSAGIDDYERKAQAMAYDSERAMFEAYSRNKYETTGIIQWMLNNAWPSMIWHLYDYYLQPAGGYFGAKKACEPLHVMYSYDDRSVAVVNSRYANFSGLKVVAEVYDLALHRRFSQQSQVDVASDGVTRAFALPTGAFSDPAPVHFVKLDLEDSQGQELSSNFYWISAKQTVYDWSQTSYRFTPASSYEDFSALQTLDQTGPIEAHAVVEKGLEGPIVRVKLANHGKQLAFQLHLGIGNKNDDAEILPVLWQDNYIELMPGESREITAQFLAPNALGSHAELRLTGWNVTPQMIALTEETNRQ